MNKLIVIIGCSLVVIAFCVLLYKQYKKITKSKKVLFPPWPSHCPDYWDVRSSKKTLDENGNPKYSIKCKNTHKIGKCMTGEGRDAIMDFSNAPFNGNRGRQYKCEWSKKCNTPWEGIDNLC